MKITIGTKFRYHYADANPEWEVKASRGRGVWTCVIVDCPDYSGTTKLFSTREISGSIGMTDMWQKLGNESDEFFNRQVPGTILHYSNGFNQFVRCKVTSDKQLLPIALVGDWREYDLPRRQRDGTIYLGYHAQTVKEMKIFRPNASHMYEYNITRSVNQQPMSFARWGDPTKMKPVSLTVPEMTEEQEKTAQLWQLVDAAKNMLNTDESDPAKLLLRLKHLVS
jgi:hypothetical protein